jgi:hypothetical protein
MRCPNCDDILEISYDKSECGNTGLYQCTLSFDPDEMCDGVYHYLSIKTCPNCNWYRANYIPKSEYYEKMEEVIYA